VQLPFSLFLALRFIKPKRTFLSVITVVSVLGVTLGIAVMILVISVMTGFDLELKRKVLGFEPHLVADAEGYPVEKWRETAAFLARRKGIRGASAFVKGPVLLASEAGAVRAALMRGIDSKADFYSANLREMVIAGEFKLDNESVVMGAGLARSLGLLIGQKITVYPAKDFSPVLKALEEAESSADPKKSLDKIRALVLPLELTLTGVFQSGRDQYDSEILLVSLANAQDLYNLKDAVHGVGAWLREPYAAPVAAEKLAGLIPDRLRLYTWIDENQEIFDAIRMERNTLFFLLLFIVVVAAFSIMNTLITVTVMKTREIGVMKALGANRSQIIWVFLTQGMIVGILGNITGVALGLSVLAWRNEFKDWLSARLGIQIFPPGIYQFSQIPAEIIPSWIAIICVSAFVICSLAALFPAMVAARLDPVKALRHD
jgi:lipoprotein-releasing system permease protein